MNNSEIIKSFLDMINESESMYQIAYDKVNELDKASGDILHKLELDNLSYSDNCKLMTQLKTLRKDRRYYKDLVEEYEVMKKYYNENKKAVDLLKQKLGDMRRIESYHSVRTYKPRVLKGDINGI